MIEIEELYLTIPNSKKVICIVCRSVVGKKFIKTHEIKAHSNIIHLEPTTSNINLLKKWNIEAKSVVKFLMKKQSIDKLSMTVTTYNQ